MKSPDQFDLEEQNAFELSVGDSVHLRVEPEPAESDYKFVDPGENVGLQAELPMAGSMGNSTGAGMAAMQPDEICPPLDLSFLWAYWTLLILGVGLGGFGVVTWSSHDFHSPIPFSIPVIVGASPGLIIRVYQHICWRKSIATAIQAGDYRWADVTIIKQPDSFDRGLHLHVLIDGTLLLPVSESDNQFDQKLFLEIVREPVARRKIFYLPESDVPVAVAVGNFYLLLAQSKRSFWSSYGIQVILFMLGAQILFFWKLGRAFQPGFF